MLDVSNHSFTKGLNKLKIVTYSITIEETLRGFLYDISFIYNKCMMSLLNARSISC